MVQGQAKRTTLASVVATVHPQTEVIELPPARKSGGMPLISALQARHSTREFSDQSLSKHMLIYYGPPSASTARTAIEPRRIGGTSW